MFIAALFTIANMWKQPKCPSIDERIKKTGYILKKKKKEDRQYTYDGMLLDH